MTDHKKQRKDKPAHKENEAIEFEFNIGEDDCNEIAMTLYKSGMLLSEDDAKKVINDFSRFLQLGSFVWKKLPLYLIGTML